MTAIPQNPRTFRAQAARNRFGLTCRGFTLVELLVSIAIVSILASLSLAGLSVTRQRSRIDKTKSTIRKIHELVVPHYESFVRRRVPMLGASGPKARLLRLRQIVMFEMPDSWEDVAVSGISAIGTLPSSSEIPEFEIPDFAWTGVTRTYGEYQRAMLTLPKGTEFRATFPSSECLYMIVSCGLGEPDVMEQFRSDEIGDVDNDGAPEFIDGWGQPIAFIRWPVGFESAIQSRNANLQPDPFDPLKVSDPINYPNLAAPQLDYSVTPLIMSGGPNGVSAKYGISTGGIKWHTLFIPSAPQYTLRAEHASPKTIAGATDDAAVTADNITNHDLFSK